MRGRRRNPARDDSSLDRLADMAGAGAALAAPGIDHDQIFRLIFDRVGVGIWQSTPEGRYLRVNRRCAELMGYDSPEAAVSAITDIGRQIYADPAERESFKLRLAAEGRVSGFIGRHRRRDGSLWWARLSAVAVCGADGKPLFYVGSAEDVSELIETQEQLRRAERDSREIWENAAEGMYRSSPDGRQLRANPALVRLNGYSSQAEMLRCVDDIAREWYVDPARRAEFKRLLQEHGRVADFESEIYRHKTRERIWISENAWEVRDAWGTLLYYEGTVRDITVQKHAEWRIRESEERFRDFAEASSDWYWETDAGHVITYISDALRTVRGDPAKYVGIRRHDLAIAAEEDPARWREHLTAMDRHEPFRDFAYKIPGPDGQTQSISVSGKPIFGTDGAFRGYRGTGRVITEQTRQQELLRFSEQRFRDYADTASDWFWESDAENRFTYLSSSDRRPFARNTPALGRKLWDDADDVSDDPVKWAAHQAALERHEPFRNFAFRVRNAKDEAEYIAASGKPVFDAQGVFHGYRGSARRITDEMRQQAMLRESEERFRDFAGTASDWFWESDPEHRISYVSDSANMLSGGRRNNAIGKQRWELAADLETEAEKWSAFRASLDRHEPFRDFKYRIRLSNGEQHYVAVSGKPVFATDGTFLRYRGSSRVITDAILQEDRLKDAKAHAEAASATKSAFLANMSHELRTPLNAIIGFSEIMDREMFGKIGVPRYSDYVRDIHDSSQHLLRLIEDILDLSKAEAGKMELEETEVDLGASIHSSCLMLRERAKLGGVALEEDVPAGLPALWGDRRRIRQVLLNLVSNAVKFTRRGGTVTVSAAANAQGGLELSVSDTGIGIDPRDIQRVFEPFVQLGREKSLSGEGTGLGLPLCKELIELHGGAIGLVSQPGAGTTVTAVFPAARTAGKRAAA